MGLGNFFLSALPPPSQLANNQLQPAMNPLDNLPNINVQDLQSIPSLQVLNNFVIPLIAIFAIMLIGIIAIRIYQNDTAYYGVGTRLPYRYRIFMRDQGHFDCRLTKVDPMLLEEALDIIKRVPEIMANEKLKDGVDWIKDRVVNKELHLYHAKIINRKNIRLRGNVGYGMVLSTGNLDDPRYYYQLDNSIVSANGREYPRVVECLKHSKSYKLLSATRKITPVFVLAPVIDPENNKTVKISDSLQEFDIPPVILQLNLIMAPKELAQIMLILQTTADLYERYEAKVIQSDSLAKMFKAQQEETISKQLEGDYLRGEIAQQELEKIGASEIKKEKDNGWLWFVALAFAGFVGIIVPPSMPQLSTMPVSVSFIIAVIIVAILKFATDKKKETPEERMKNRSLRVGNEPRF